jgi:hypothetical protein
METKYLVFDPNRPHPPYLSFVTIPLVATSQDCLGVLCFDSSSAKVFDPPDIRELLVALGTRVATAAVIYQEMMESDAQPPPSQ